MRAARPGGFAPSVASPDPVYPCGVSVLLWWLIPIGITVLAVLWATLRARPAKPAEGHDGMASLRRFQEAMERPLPALERDDADRPGAQRGDAER